SRLGKLLDSLGCNICSTNIYTGIFVTDWIVHNLKQFCCGDSQVRTLANRYGTGSGSDLVLAGSIASASTSRYRSLYRTIPNSPAVSRTRAHPGSIGGNHFTLS